MLTVRAGKVHTLEMVKAASEIEKAGSAIGGSEGAKYEC